MTDVPRSIDPETLLAHTGWMRALARGLVDDEATAEDLVQQAWTAALERPPRDPDALGGWLARVMRNLAARGLRDSARRERRERRAARPEPADLNEVVERAELLGEVMRAVLELEEPFRSTVLLRYHEELSPEQVARRLGVPLATVGTRLHRALAQLRARLDHRPGGRRAWVALLAPWAGIAAALGAAAGSAQAAGSTAIGGGSGTATFGPAAAASAAGAATVSTLSATGTPALIGGIIVMQKSFIAAAFAGALCAAVGFGVGRKTAPPASPAEGEKIVAESEYRALVDGERTAQDTLAALRSQFESALAEKEQLAARASAAEEALAAATKPPETAESAIPSSLAVSFGAWGDLAELREADWLDLGSAVVAINDLVVPLVADLDAGRPVSTSTQREIQQHNGKLVEYGVRIIKKLPSNSPMPVNGEFTHPISLMNLMAGMLETAGVPFTPVQRGQLAALGAEYDRDFAEVNAAYGESTWQLTKILDELSLKRDTMLEVENLLTAAQREFVAIPRIQNRIRLDTLSPVNMVSMNVGAMLLEDRARLRAEVVDSLEEMLSIPDETFEANGDLLAAYEQAVAPLLEETVARETAQFVHLDDIIIAGRAAERLLADIATRLTLTDEMRSSVADLQGWVVPQLLTPVQNP